MGGRKRKVTNQVLSLPEVIDEDDALHSAADAVLGASNAEECSYSNGYMKRQALFACATCTIRHGECAGVCLACSLECHDGHEMFEIYTKRAFRCDCGNRKFVDLRCKLDPAKKKTNSKNIYGQNFKGLYCSCHRPCPDPEDETDDEMIQCVVCEDWYHGRHLGDTTLPDDFDNYEMVCSECSIRCSFIPRYSSLFASPNEHERLKPGEENQTAKSNGDAGIQKKNTAQAGSSSSVQSACNITDEIPVRITGAIFLKPEWRSELCRCVQCLQLYTQLNVAFLLDEEDTVRFYEEKGMQNRPDTDASTALQGMSRTTQVELIHGYNEMRDGLRDFLRPFAESGDVVEADDVTEFFQGLSKKKRRTGFSYFCG